MLSNHQMYAFIKKENQRVYDLFFNKITKIDTKANDAALNYLQIINANVNLAKAEAYGDFIACFDTNGARINNWKNIKGFLNQTQIHALEDSEYKIKKTVCLQTTDPILEIILGQENAYELSFQLWKECLNKIIFVKETNDFALINWEELVEKKDDYIMSFNKLNAIIEQTIKKEITGFNTTDGSKYQYMFWNKIHGLEKIEYLKLKQAISNINPWVSYVNYLYHFYSRFIKTNPSLMLFRKNKVMVDTPTFDLKSEQWNAEFVVCLYSAYNLMRKWTILLWEEVKKLIVGENKRGYTPLTLDQIIAKIKEKWSTEKEWFININRKRVVLDIYTKGKEVEDMEFDVLSFLETPISLFPKDTEAQFKKQIEEVDYVEEKGFNILDLVYESQEFNK